MVAANSFVCVLRFLHNKFEVVSHRPAGLSLKERQRVPAAVHANYVRAYCGKQSPADAADGVVVVVESPLRAVGIANVDLAAASTFEHVAKVVLHATSVVARVNYGNLLLKQGTGRLLVRRTHVH
jgi:hypothetical protein